jgi:hypothetical protein
MRLTALLFDPPTRAPYQVARQAGVRYHSPDLLEDKAAELKMAAYDTLSPAKKKMVVDVVEQEYLAYLFINNSNA